jgi:hypothetical protein
LFFKSTAVSTGGNIDDSFTAEQTGHQETPVCVGTSVDGTDFSEFGRKV